MIVGLQQGQETFGKFFLWIQDIFESTRNWRAKNRVALKLDTFPNNTAFRWSHEFNLGVISIACAHHHTLRHNVRQLPWFEIDEDDTQTLCHLGKRYELLKA